MKIFHGYKNNFRRILGLEKQNGFEKQTICFVKLTETSQVRGKTKKETPNLSKHACQYNAQ